MKNTCRTKYLLLMASGATTILSFSAPASAQQRNFNNVCVKAYREQFRCEEGKNAAYARETSIQREGRFCEKVASNENHYVEKSLKSGTSVAAYWNTTRGRKELEDVKKFCSFRQIDKMRDYFCQAYSPRCAPVLAKIDRQNGVCPTGGKECLNEAKRREREAIQALEQQKLELERTKAASAESLRELLERAALYLDSKADALRDLPEATSGLALDRQAYEDTLDAMNREGGFVMMMAASSRTDDPGLRGLLWMSAAVRGLQETSEAGIADATQAGTELVALEAATADRENRMASVLLSTITDDSKREQHAQAEYPVRALSKEIGLLELMSPAKALKKEEIEGAQNAVSSSEISKAGTAMAGNARYPEKAKPSLRELLTKKLNEGSKTSDGLEGAAAHLASPELILANAKNSKSESGGGAGASGEREIAGEREGMIGLTPDQAPGRGLASAAAADGSSGDDNLTLFQRVKRMHRQVTAEGRVFTATAEVKVAARH